MCHPSVDAQVVGGTIFGSVKDASGANLPRAHITVTNVATGIGRDLETDHEGFYRASNLIPGTYRLSASAQGFATLVKDGVALEVGTEVVADLQLHVGATQERVETTAGVPIIASSSSSLESVVNGTTIRELPLNARDWTALATLEPGVATVRQVGLNANPGVQTEAWEPR